MGGVSYLQYLRELARRVDADWPGVRADLERVRAAALTRAGALVSLTGDERVLRAAEAPLADFLASLPAEPAGGAAAAQEGWAGALPRVNEALLVPTQVSYVAKAANLYEDAGYKLSGSAYVINKFLGTSWLWDR